MVEQKLPVENIKPQFELALRSGPVVVSALTGSGKSTQIPRWCSQTGRVLVIEPRRVACRGLAQWVAKLEGTNLGQKVGYTVRDDHRVNNDTQILFATPGMVLRWLSNDDLPHFDTVILDEFHERGLDTDLILALLKSRFKGNLVVMSATMDGRRVAEYLGGEHIVAEGRTFPVAIHHVPGNAILPDARGLEDRVGHALKLAAKDPGDVLIFLPGKAEISKIAKTLTNSDFEVLQMHGGLTLEEQSAVFSPGKKRRIILTTNVAETSITVPSVGVVIDSGLVRRTRYFNGRGFLTLVPVAKDSADQRSGRAGRTAAGVGYRLWNQQAVIAAATPPEIFRESLSGLLLATAACGAKIEKLTFFDAPKDYAIKDANDELTALGTIDKNEAITERGKKIFGLPLDPGLASLLIEAQREGCIEDAIDLVSVLSVGRPLFTRNHNSDEEDNLRSSECDAIAYIRAIREGKPARHGLNQFVLEESRRIRKRLREAWSLPNKNKDDLPINRSALVMAALRSDPRCAYVARRRKARVFWGNGGPEIELARDSALNEEQAQAMAVLGSMAVGMGHRDSKIWATCAMPVTFAQLVRAGLGEDEVDHVDRAKQKVIARIKRIYAGQIIEKREENPKGKLARDAVKALFLRGSIFSKSLKETRNRLEATALLQKLKTAGYAKSDIFWDELEDTKTPSLEDWIDHRLINLGVESGEDLALLSAEDLLVKDVPTQARQWLERSFPLSLSLGDAHYKINYDLIKHEVTLDKTDGKRKTPPSLATLPSFTGFRVRVKHHSKVWVLKEKR